MTKWEYKYHIVKNLSMGLPDIDMLLEEGKEGWELCGVERRSVVPKDWDITKHEASETMEISKAGMLYLFKRELE